METTQSRSAANDPIYRKYQRIAPLYDLIDSPLERAWKGNLRPLLFKNLSGHVLDAGAGTGLNAPHYPDGVRVTGMDISPAMLAKATKRARKLGKDASYRAMDLFQLSFPSETFDHAVAAFLFCNLPPERQLAALQQVQRVIKPGGHLRLIDYRMVEGGVGKLAMRLRTPWLRLIFGATFDPKTESHIEEAGLELVEQRILMGGKIQFLDMRRPETG